LQNTPGSNVCLIPLFLLGLIWRPTLLNLAHLTRLCFASSRFCRSYSQPWAYPSLFIFLIFYLPSRRAVPLAPLSSCISPMEFEMFIVLVLPICLVSFLRSKLASFLHIFFFTFVISTDQPLLFLKQLPSFLSLFFSLSKTLAQTFLIEPTAVVDLSFLRTNSTSRDGPRIPSPCASGPFFIAVPAGSVVPVVRLKTVANFAACFRFLSPTPQFRN